MISGFPQSATIIEDNIHTFALLGLPLDIGESWFISQFFFIQIEGNGDKT